jgi:SAM-dependent methyltransferase
METSQLLKSLNRVATAPHPPLPWRDGTQIPWNELEFSRRMLAVHLDQSTQMASRTEDVISSHVRWLWNTLKREGPPGDGKLHILDAGCGPGLYCHELARRGARATGLDFAPAPLAYARQVTQREELDCHFFNLDLTSLPADLCETVGYADAVTFWFAEFHSFRPPVAQCVLRDLAQCLRPGGLFVLEFQPYNLFPKQPSQEWQACQRSAFSDEPHLWLQEYNWDEKAQAEINVHWIIEAKTGKLQRYAQSHQAYREAELVSLLTKAGLGDPTFHPPVAGISQRFEFPLCVTRKE